MWRAKFLKWIWPFRNSSDKLTDWSVFSDDESLMRRLAEYTIDC